MAVQWMLKKSDRYNLFKHSQFLNVHICLNINSMIL